MVRQALVLYLICKEKASWTALAFHCGLCREIRAWVGNPPAGWGSPGWTYCRGSPTPRFSSTPSSCSPRSVHFSLCLLIVSQAFTRGSNHPTCRAGAMALLAPGAHGSAHWRALCALLQRASSQDGLSEGTSAKIKEGNLPFVFEAWMAVELSAACKLQWKKKIAATFKLVIHHSNNGLNNNNNNKLPLSPLPSPPPSSWTVHGYRIPFCWQKF